MLTLSRKVGEKIMLTVNGQLVTLMVVRVSHDKVWLGFEAPQEIAINREEVQDAINREGRGV